MMRTVRLELARCRDFPEGSDKHGYEFHVPLTKAGMLDRDGLHDHREEATFRRFWGGEDETWACSTRPPRLGVGFRGRREADGTIFKGDLHCFAPGEYVSIEERDEQTRTFRVVTVH